MFGRLLARGVPAETRRYISSNTAYLTRDQPLSVLTTRCLAARSSTALPSIVLPSIRCYATEPKTSTAKSSTKSTTRKKAPATKSTTKAKPKAATKSKAKASTKSKPKPKPKKKPAAKKKKTTTKRKPKTGPTELQKKRTKVNQLRKIALLHPPKLLPQNSYLVFSTEQTSPKGASVVDTAKATGSAWRGLSADQKERYTSMASQNVKANAETMKKWISSHTALEIEVANSARRHLNRIAKEPKPAGASSALVAHPVYLLKDDRRLKRPSQPYISFVAERWASGDMKDVPVRDASKSLSAEWKQLPDAQKQKYVQEYEQARAQYVKEYEQVHGKPPGPTKSPKKNKAT